MGRTVAIDIHKRFAEVAVHEEGHVRRFGRVEVAELEVFAASLLADDHVVIESTSQTWVVVELLSRHVERVTVSNPMRTRAIASAKVKTDKVDARVLAQLGAADFLPPVWQPDEATQVLRRRVAHRAGLVRQRTRLRNQVHAVLTRNLISIEATDLFGRKGRRALEKVELPAHERENVDCALRLHDALDAEIRLVERVLAERALSDPGARLLMSIRGVGPMTSLSIMSVIGDIARFESSRQLVSYFGLDPRVRQSGDRAARHGHISREGQAHARGLLIEAKTLPDAPRAHGYARAVTGHEAEEDAVRAYVEDQTAEQVVHAEHAASEMVGPARHDVWDVHCTDSRWWVLSNPTHLYSQHDFKSRDVALTFHVGLTMRMAYLDERRVPVAPTPTALLHGSWRRWQQAFETYESGNEAETFQAVGVRLRESLISFVDEATDEAIVPDGVTPPKAANFKGWSELLADHLAPGPSASRLRSYLKKLLNETWEFVDWLTHAKNAVRLDAEMGLKAVEHLFGFFTAARMRSDRAALRCEQCGSYDLRAGRCTHCGWVDESYEPPESMPLTDEERTERLAQPCTPSSDISTYLRPGDVG